MSDWPDSVTPPVWAPTHINSYSRYCVGEQLRMNVGTANTASMTWGTANTAIYIPLSLPFPYLINRLFWVNGSTATANIDVGIYSDDGARLVSTGSTGQSGGSAPQYVTLGTPMLLAPGFYYLAYACSSTTSRSWGLAPVTAAGRMIGLMTQATALPLPATMTPATYGSTLGLPMCGITRTTSGF